MSNGYFQFKQFTVWQDRCAMKVGTDGTLLGAAALSSYEGGILPGATSLSHDERGTMQESSSPSHDERKALTETSSSSHDERVENKEMWILDVGTGTGLVALMLAQRFPTALIDAIDIDGEACSQAADNVFRSPFKERINIVQQSFLDFPSLRKYDLVVSNPPYFERSLKSPDKGRNRARHSDSLPLRNLVAHARTMLAVDGLIALILPSQLSDELTFIVATNGLFVVRRTDIVSIEGAAPKRFIVELSPKPHSPKQETLILTTPDHHRTQQYSALMKDFHI
jgi:tRNA1Val (adenine37-N6)-methyltransferase